MLSKTTGGLREMIRKALLFGGIALVGFTTDGRAQQVPSSLVQERLDEFARAGLGSGLLDLPFDNCTNAFDQELLGALFQRQWSAERTSELLSLARNLVWNRCPNSQIDRWLIGQMEGASSWNIDRILAGIRNRNAPTMFDDLIEIASNERVSGEGRAEALGVAGRTLTTEGRIGLYVDWIERPDVPMEYVLWEGNVLSAGARPALFLDALSPTRIASLSPTVAQGLIAQIGLVFSRVNGASELDSEQARQLLVSTAPLVGEDTRQFIQRAIATRPRP